MVKGLHHLRAVGKRTGRPGGITRSPYVILLRAWSGNPILFLLSMTEAPGKVSKTGGKEGGVLEEV